MFGRGPPPKGIVRQIKKKLYWDREIIIYLFFFNYNFCKEGSSEMLQGACENFINSPINHEMEVLHDSPDPVLSCSSQAYCKVE